MIICYTGTGNSRRVADLLRGELGDEIVRPSPGVMRDPRMMNLEVTDGRVIWVFPCHSWGLPNVTARAMCEATITSPEPVKHYMVCTCGDDVGVTDRQWRRLMHKRGWSHMGAFSVQMPNTYVFLPGFDVDPQEVAERKLQAVPARINEIACLINQEYKTTDVVRGLMPWSKSRIIHPVFMKFMTLTSPFRYTEQCNGCGRCAHNCPINAIEMVDDRPRWQSRHCIMCSRCYHNCRRHAIAYGSSSRGKGQYICPGYQLGDPHTTSP